MTHINVVAEIGINHNGSVDTAIKMIEAAKKSGADYVKFQKREPMVDVPVEQWEVSRETPWGTISYIEYKKKMEISLEEYGQIDRACKDIDIPWFPSVFSKQAAQSIVSCFSPRYIKIPSAKLTDDMLLDHLRKRYMPTILSTGMSTINEVKHAVQLLAPAVVMQCTSSYPCPDEDINLQVLKHYRDAPWLSMCEIGYSGHEFGIAPTIAAAAIGATWIERHFTLDKTSWGTDQYSSIEPREFADMVRSIRSVERALGDGYKSIMPSEEDAKGKLRGMVVKNGNGH